MSAFAELAESRIQEALAAGEDRSLAGRGGPVDLDGYFAAPSGLRAGFGLLKSAGVVPPEVSAMQEVQRLRRLRRLLAGTADPRQQAALRRELQAREVELAFGLERMKRSLRADATL